MNYTEFVKAIKKLNVNSLLKETTQYDFDHRGVYAEKAGKLIGYYNPASGGTVFSRPMTQWSRSHRSFEKIKI